jgi:hypothetical protein
VRRAAPSPSGLGPAPRDDSRATPSCGGSHSSRAGGPGKSSTASTTPVQPTRTCRGIGRWRHSRFSGCPTSRPMDAPAALHLPEQAGLRCQHLPRFRGTSQGTRTPGARVRAHRDASGQRDGGALDRADAAALAPHHERGTRRHARLQATHTPPRGRSSADHARKAATSEPPPRGRRAGIRAVRSAPGPIRTADLSLRRRALYPLSYGRGTVRRTGRHPSLGKWPATTPGRPIESGPTASQPMRDAAPDPVASCEFRR